MALLFFRGWRVSEALGLAWEDIHLDAGVARVQRACVHVNHRGAQLGPTKTAGVMGTHQLVPTVVELLRARRVTQNSVRTTIQTEPRPNREPGWGSRGLRAGEGRMKSAVVALPIRSLSR